MIGWNDLIPVVKMEDPYLQLTAEQRSLIWDVAMAEIEAKNNPVKNTNQNPEIKKKVDRLAELGIDAQQVIDGLRQFAQLKAEKTTATVTELNGSEIRMGGFLLPLDISDNKSTEFLLVPWVGACIHTPPPPKNQIVYIRFPEGRKVEKQYNAVWIEGKLEVGESTNKLFLVDGTDDILSGYQMKPNSIETFK